MNDELLGDSIRSAAKRRQPLLDAGIYTYRLLHGYGEGVDGLTIDRYEDAAAIRYRSDIEPRLPAIAGALVTAGDFTLITARHRRFGSEPRALVGDIGTERVEKREGDLRLLLHFSRRGNPGIYLDARPIREWLMKNSADRRVLNLFSFTGSLGIAAARGGAASVVHVDSHGPTLAWAKANCELNGLPVDDRDFARINVYQHLRKQSNGRRRYGGIILDPPPGPSSPRGKDRSPGERGVAALAPLAARTLEPGGWLLCFLHHDMRPRDVIESEIATACELEVGWRGESGIDFPEATKSTQLRVTAFFRA